MSVNPANSARLLAPDCATYAVPTQSSSYAATELFLCLPTLVEDLLDIVGRPYDGIDYVVLHHIHETMLDPGESDHPSPPLG